jgi:hypothetical protein
VHEQQPNDSAAGTVLQHFVAVQEAYRQITRRGILRSIFFGQVTLHRMVLWGTTIAVAGLFSVVVIEPARLGPSEPWSVGLGAALALLAAAFDAVQRREYQKLATGEPNQVLRVDRRMVYLRYLLFREKVRHLQLTATELQALQPIVKGESELEDLLRKRPVVLGLLVIILLAFTQAAVRQPVFWHGGVGWSILIALAVAACLIWLTQRQLAGIWLGRAYRKRELVFFLQLLAAEAATIRTAEPEEKPLTS